MAGKKLTDTPLNNGRLHLRKWLDAEVTFDSRVMSRDEMIRTASRTFAELSQGANEDITDLNSQLSGGELEQQEEEMAKVELGIQERLKSEYYDPFAAELAPLVVAIDGFTDARTGSNVASAADVKLFGDIHRVVVSLYDWYYEDKYAKLRTDFGMGFVKEEARKLAKGTKEMPLTDEEVIKLHQYFCKFMSDNIATALLDDILAKGITSDVREKEYYHLFVKNKVPDAEAKRLSEMLRGFSTEMAVEVGRDYVQGRREDLEVYRTNARTLNSSARTLQAILQRLPVRGADVAKG